MTKNEVKFAITNVELDHNEATGYEGLNYRAEINGGGMKNGFISYNFFNCGHNHLLILIDYKEIYYGKIPEGNEHAFINDRLIEYFEKGIVMEH